MLQGRISSVLTASLVATALFYVVISYSSSLRPAYVHLLFNLLVIALGADAGILRVPSKSTLEFDSDNLVVHQVNEVDKVMCDIIETADNLAKEPTIICGEKSSHGSAMVTTVSIATEYVEDDETAFSNRATDETASSNSTTDDEEEDADEISELELFVRAEEFIEKFYKQLKMQSQNPYDSLHDFSFEQR